MSKSANPKIKKILIANRGEIACRIMKTCRKMGISSVAVYSDADRRALHVRMANEAVHIGASPAAESYLVIDKIIDACKSSGADAVHPGYGFLSENPQFARRLKKEGIIFIGPSPESMEAMGLKDAAKKLMEKAGVPVTPGYHGKDQDPKLLKAKAGEIGYPVLIKAIAGGGGKGMRKVDTAANFGDALASCQREAKSSFGDDRVLIEKYILSPRHIEVQVFGDTHGNIVHMFERDCSLQRRHQKVIEEAPAPGMTNSVRKAMTDAATEAARAVNYVGAGTVEFIVDGLGELRPDGFWFMEMNTRLQVEHPVTEMITGLDLIELQIRVARDEKLPKQKDIKMTGHAVEARIYAEDPANDFLPSIGKLTLFEVTGMLNSVRVDTGISQNDSISIYYDPMIAKMIGYGASRNEAINNLSSNFGYSNISGVKTNMDFLSRLINQDDFKNGSVETNYIQTHINALLPPELSRLNEAYALAASALAFPEHWIDSPNRSPFEASDGWKLNSSSSQNWHFERNGKLLSVQITNVTKNHWRARVEGSVYLMQRECFAEDVDDKLSLTSLNEWASEITDSTVILSRGDITLNLLKFTPTALHANTASGNVIIAPMPGKIIDVNVAVGSKVNAGDMLIIMEAMKMEMSLEAPRGGIVANINCETGALVPDGEILLELEPST